MITTNDETVYRRLLRLRSHGINKLDDPLVETAQSQTDGANNPWYYEMQELGWHYRISDIQCALGRSQLRKVDRFVARRRELATVYDRALAGLKHVRPAQTAGRERSGHHLYAVRIDFRALGKSRAAVMKELRRRQIMTQVHYIPVPWHPHYRSLGLGPGAYPEAENYYAEALSIPLFYDLTSAEQEEVIEALRSILT